MFFVFFFIFVKIYSIQTTIAADVDKPVELEVLCKQDTNSPPRKTRRETTGKKTSAEEFEEQLIRQLTDSTHISPVRKNHLLKNEDKDKENDEINTPPLTLEIIVPPLPSSRPYTGGSSSQTKDAYRKGSIDKYGFVLTPPTIDETDDEDDSGEIISPAGAYRKARIPSRQSLTPRNATATKKTSPRFHHKEDNKEITASASLFKATGKEDDSDEERDDFVAEAFSPDSVKGQLTPRQRQLLHEEFKLTERSINLMDGCNRALYLKANDPAFAALLEAYSDPEEKKTLIILKDQYPSPIRSPHLLTQSLFYTPAARVGLGRSDLIEAKGIELTTSLPADAFLMPFTPPTAEEKAEIEKQQQELLEELERERGKSALDVTAEIKAEAEIWGKYFSYIQARKTKIAKEGAKKIRKNEILDLFATVIEPHYQMVAVGAYKVYFSMVSLDLRRQDTKGRTNLQRLRDNSLCPIGPDHFEMNFHHLTHYDALSHGGESVIVLITKKLHTDFSGSLHFRRRAYQDLPHTDMDRAAFGQVRASFGPAIVEAIEKLGYVADSK